MTLTRLTRRLTLGAALAALAVGPLAAQTTKWDMPTPYPDGNYHTQNIRWFVDEVKKATNGAVEITVHSGASLFKMPEIKRAVSSGQAAIGEFLLSAYGNEDPIYEADGIPFLASGPAAAWKLYQAQKPMLEERFAKQGMRLLYSVAWPGQGVYSKQALNTLDDLKGSKFRAYNAATSRLAALLGAQPVTVQAAEVPQAFATGVVETMITSSATGADTKAWEYAKFYYDTSAWMPRNVVVVNARAFQRLPEPVQTQILNVARQAEERGWQLVDQVTKDSQAKLTAGGMTVAPPSAAMQAGFKDIGATMIAEWVQKAGPDGRKIADAMK